MLGPFGEAVLELLQIQGKQREQRPLVMELRREFRGDSRQHRLNPVARFIPLGGEPLFAVVAHQRQEEVVALAPEVVQGQSSGLEVGSIEREQLE